MTTLETPPSPEVCKECEKLEQQYKTSTEAIAAKQRRYSEMPPQRNDATQPTETAGSNAMPASPTNPSSFSAMSANLSRAAISATSISSSGRAASDSLDEIVTATVGDVPDNVYFVEIDDDQIHITTASTEATETSCDGGTSSVRSMFYSSARIESINSRSTEANDNNNNNNGNVRAVVAQPRMEQFADDDDKSASNGNGVAATFTTATTVSSAVDDATDTGERVGNKSHMSTNNGGGNNNNNNTNTGDADPAIDKYISNLLIDSLNNVVIAERDNGRAVDAVNGNEIGKPPLQKSETHTVDDIEPMVISTEAYSTTNYEIFFPRYASVESPGNESDCSAKYSNETDAIELPQNYMIAMNPGSSYPGYLDNNAGAMIVCRMIQLPRTESMEVQASSSASAPDDLKIDSDEESVSLVDSLDDPAASKRGDDDLPKDLSPRHYDKGEAFFVPIVSSTHSTEPVDESRVEASIANAMPEKLREKLAKREDERKRREEEERRRFDYGPIEVVPRHERRRKIGRVETHFNPPSEDSSTAVAATSSIGPIALKAKGRFLRSEIGLLESYTIDSQGNLKFKVPPAAPTAAAIRTVRKVQNDVTGRRNIVQHTTVMKKVSASKPQPLRSKKEADKRAAARATSKPSKQSLISNGSTTKKSTDIQQMTLYHQSHSDLITPDADCGPRRMYQKTEIHDGEKRIEILEIVECLNSSPDDSEASPTSSSAPSFVPSLPTKYSRLSKIPVPVAALSASTSARTRYAKEPSTQGSLTRSSTSRETMPSNGSGASHLVKNLQQIGNNSKVDQIIADLLIEALNHSTEFGIEFVKAPLDDQLTAKRTKVSRRNGLNGSGKRSACSGKYQGVFAAIPEEKSNISVETASDDRGPTVGTLASAASAALEQEIVPTAATDSSISSSESGATNLPTAPSLQAESVASTQATAIVASTTTANATNQSTPSINTANSIVTSGTTQSTVKTVSTAQSSSSNKTVASMAKSSSTTKSTITTISTVSNGIGKSSTISSIVKAPGVNNSSNGSIKSAITTPLSSIKSQTFNTSTNGSHKSASTSSASTTSSAATTIQSTARTNMPEDRSAVSRGRAAIDEQIKPDAWFDCFGRSHTDSPIVDNKNPAPTVDEGIVRYLHKTRVFA